MTTLGVGSVISSVWLQPLAIALLVITLGALFLRARRLRRYRPLFLGLVAAVAMYLCKFKLNFDVGAYISAATLFGASVWSAIPRTDPPDDIRCSC